MMSNKDLFIERRPQGDFAVRRANAERASAVAPTQAKAIAEARRLESNATVLVERVRHTSVGKPDKWRRP
jgi:pyridoxine/pyridoxamine 5'-phosphate oxidase